MQRIMGVKYSFPSSLQLSTSCVDLISKVFVGNPANRINITGIRAHPWFLKNLPEELRVGCPAPQDWPKLVMQYRPQAPAQPPFFPPVSQFRALNIILPFLKGPVIPYTPTSARTCVVRWSGCHEPQHLGQADCRGGASSISGSWQLFRPAVQVVLVWALVCCRQCCWHLCLPTEILVRLRPRTVLA